MSPPKKDSFESHLREAEAVIEKLESGELPLEESLSTYEKGIAALKKCYAILAGAEQKVERLIAEKEGLVGLKEKKKKL